MSGRNQDSVIPRIVKVDLRNRKAMETNRKAGIRWGSVTDNRFKPGDRFETGNQNQHQESAARLMSGVDEGSRGNRRSGNVFAHQENKCRS